MFRLFVFLLAALLTFSGQAASGELNPTDPTEVQPRDTNGSAQIIRQVRDWAPFILQRPRPGSNTPITVPGVPLTGITVNPNERVKLTTNDFLLHGGNLTERKIIIKITEPLPDGHGKLVRVDRPEERLQNFTLDDLDARRIQIIAPSEKTIGTITDDNGVILSFGFQVLDERAQSGAASPNQTFFIQVLSSNVDPPTSKIINITVTEGQSEPIPPDFFFATDPDTDLRNLTYRMHLSPHEGRLVSFIDGIPTDVPERIDEPRDQFVGKSYRYQHDGRNLDPDWAEIQVSDGKHNGTLRINVQVLPVNG